MKSNIVSKFIGVALLAISAISCMKETELTYTGGAVVEFKNHLFGRSASYVPVGVFPSSNTNPMNVRTRYISANNRGTDSILVQLVGPQRSTDTQVGFSVASSSTATEGTHFTFRNPNVTIPANSSAGYVLVDLIPGSVASDEVVSLTVNLEGNTEVLPSENYRVFTLNIRP